MSGYEEEFLQAFRVLIKKVAEPVELKWSSDKGEKKSETKVDALSACLWETLNFVTKHLKEEINSQEILRPLQQNTQRECNTKNVRELLKMMPPEIFSIHKSTEKRCRLWQKEQLYFASKVLNHVLNFYELECHKEEVEEVANIYTESMGQAVVGISRLYRGKWRETFELLSKSSTEPKDFISYCLKIPVYNYNVYFFSILQRTAIILELALFFFELGRDYFEIAVHCVADFVDVEFFVDAGGWEKLERAADLISILISPLRNVMSCDGTSCENCVFQYLPGTKTIECKRLCGQYVLFRNLDKLLEALDDKSESKDLLYAPMTVKSKCQVLMKYFEICCKLYFERKKEQPPQFPDGSFLSAGQECIIELGSWMNVPVVEPELEVTATSNIVKESGHETESIGFKTEDNIKEFCCSSVATDIPMNMPGKAIGTVPKESKLTCILRQTDYCVKNSNLYRNIFPSFLNTFLHKYFTPVFMRIDETIRGQSYIRSHVDGSCSLGNDCPIPLAMKLTLGYFKKYKTELPIPGGHMFENVINKEDKAIRRCSKFIKVPGTSSIGRRMLQPRTSISGSVLQPGTSSIAERVLQSESRPLPGGCFNPEPRPLLGGCFIPEPRPLPKAYCNPEPRSVSGAYCNAEPRPLLGGCFNPEPRPLPEAYCNPEPRALTGGCFNPEPRPLPGGCFNPEPRPLPGGCFNPEPRPLLGGCFIPEPRPLPEAYFNPESQ